MPWSFFDWIALAVIIAWPVIPMFWIPVHCLPGLFRRLGLFTYIFPAVVWAPLAFFLLSNKGLILGLGPGLPRLAAVPGLLLLFLGAVLQAWSGSLLTLKGLMGMPEVSERVESRFVTLGPYKLVRHPTYLSHTLMFAGLFLVTGLTAMGLVALLDFILVRFVVIPLEERELSARFGPEYAAYRKKIPAFFPVRLFRGDRQQLP